MLYSFLNQIRTQYERNFTKYSTKKIQYITNSETKYKNIQEWTTKVTYMNYGQNKTTDKYLRRLVPLNWRIFHISSCIKREFVRNESNSGGMK